MVLSVNYNFFFSGSWTNANWLKIENKRLFFEEDGADHFPLVSSNFLSKIGLEVCMRVNPLLEDHCKLDVIMPPPIIQLVGSGSPLIYYLN